MLPQILAKMRELQPEGGYRRYIEPFVGGASVFCAVVQDPQLRFSRPPLLLDANPDLINLYCCVQAAPQSVARDLNVLLAHWNDGTPAWPARFRAAFNRKDWFARFDRAAAMLILNRMTFNGLWRVNKDGALNAPVGPSTAGLVSPEHLSAFSTLLRGATLHARSFEGVFVSVAPGDLIFLDPPYGGLDGTAGFTAYTAGGFTAADQRFLVELLRFAKKHNVRVVLTNGDFPGNREAYLAAGLQVETLMEPRSINRDGGKRGPVPCLLAWG